jgi:hypothetical protein
MIISTTLKENFLKVLKKWMLEEISLWIKIFFVDKGLMHMKPDRMAKVDSPHIRGR